MRFQINSGHPLLLHQKRAVRIVTNKDYIDHYIIDENDPLSKLNKIPLCHNRTNGAVYSIINFKLRSALHFRYSIVISRFIPRTNTDQS